MEFEFDEEKLLFAATEQLQGVAGIAVEGLPQLELNDVYLPAGDHEGWPRFESGQGKHLYRFVKDGEWYLWDKLDQDSDEVPSAYISASDGLLPVGEHEWTCGEEDHTLTAILLQSAEGME